MLRIICLSLFVALSVSAVAQANSDNSSMKADKSFLMKAIQGDNSEIALGRLAADKGTNDKLRQLGRTLINDHEKAKNEALAVAQKIGVTPTNEITSDAKKEQDKLQGLSGADFDKEFADFAVKEHKKDIKDFEKEAKKGGDTARLARKTLPDLQKHLKMAEEIKG
jgi:putative membrane protein